MKSKILILGLLLICGIAHESYALVTEGTFQISGSNIVLTGSIDVTGANTDVPGTGTDFENELSVGSDILVFGETREIATITNSTTATVTAAWGSDLDEDLTPEEIPYATFTSAEADLGSTLTDNLTLEHLDEQTSISTDVTFGLSTGGYTLTLTAKDGEKHDGTSGNGARVLVGNASSIKIDEITNGTLDDCVISDLNFIATGTAADGILVNDGGDNGTIIVERCVIQGDGNSDVGILIGGIIDNLIIRNNIIYDMAQSGIENISANTIKTWEIYNNTIINCVTGFNLLDSTMQASLVITVKNNLFQANGTNDWVVVDATPPAGLTTDKNYTEDATSPDALQETFHDGTSNFVDYASDNFLIDSGGDSLTNLADGADLTGTFTDDIVDNTRTAADFFIGASWIDTGAAVFIPRIIMW